jgi:hypothetical protein
MTEPSCISLYRYDALSESDREFRLLRLLPASTQDELSHEPVKCSIFTFDPKKAPRYCALSYVWGPSTDQKPLLVNNLLLYITRNLDEALRHLRSSIYVQSDFIWIDAVCINQKDEAEKTRLVGCMKETFTNSAYTLSWLGSTYDILSPAFESIEKAVTALRGNQDNWLSEFAELRKGDDGTEIGTEATDAVIKLLRNEYFRRVWILQEVAVAGEVRLVCGSQHLPWDIFSDFLKAYIEEQQRSELRSRKDSETMVESVVRFANNGHYRSLPIPIILRIGLMSQNSFRSLSLQRLLWMSKISMKCSDPRDHVYALLGLAVDTEELGLKPNYKATIRSCFIETTKALLSVPGGFDVLSMCHQPRALEDLPSWVPDFSTRWYPKRPLLGPQRYPDKLDDTQPTMYTASKGTKSSFYFTQMGKDEAIVITGGIFGSIADIRNNTTYRDSDGLEEAIQHLTLSLLPVVSLIISLDIPREGRPYSAKFSAIARLARRDVEPGATGGRLTEETHIADVFLLRKLWTIADLRSQSKAIPKDLEFQLYNEESSRALSLYIGLIGNLFVTTNGYLGISEKELQIGDLVAVPLGAKVPYTIRKEKADIYRLICEAFIDGIMYGEHFEEDQSMGEFAIV